MTDRADASVPDLVAQLRADVAALDLELAEIAMLVGQTKTEAARHEQRRAQAADKLAPKPASPDRKQKPGDPAEAYAQLVTLTRRAVLMVAQVDVLEGKHRALARHRAAVAAVAERIAAMPPPPEPGSPAADGPSEHAHDARAGLPPSLSRVVLSAQEDLRREIARSMHDGPAQSLTNIVLQAQIVDRLLERDPVMASGELRLLVSMVQQTLDATKSFIFDVRPMVLDDLGLVPTLRRSTRERGRRTHVPVEFESLGQDRRLPMDVESGAFRILDAAMAAYLALAPERVVLRLDWTETLEARLSAHRTPVYTTDEPLPEMPTDDVPDALRRMIQDRHDARDAAVAAADEAAIVVLPAGARRDAIERAGSIGAAVELHAGGGELRLVIPLPPDDEGDGAAGDRESQSP